jgi:hypothetical protein
LSPLTVSTSGVPDFYKRPANAVSTTVRANIFTVPESGVSCSYLVARETFMLRSVSHSSHYYYSARWDLAEIRHLSTRVGT